MNAADDALREFLERAEARSPDTMPRAVGEVLAPLGVTRVALHLADYSNTWLQPFGETSDDGTGIRIASTPAGEAFTGRRTVEEPAGDGGVRLWVPIASRGHATGVLELHADAVTPELRSLVGAVGALLSHVVVSTARLTDRFEAVRRRRPLGLASELQWSLLPPITCELGGASIGGALEPAYEIGGDTFDYSVHEGSLDLALLDAMGHGLDAALLASLAVAALRNARREGAELVDIARVIDSAVLEGSRGNAYVTGVLVRLHVASGELAWVTAGHPPPWAFSPDGDSRQLDAPPTLPFGLRVGERSPALVEQRTHVEPGTLVLVVSDGVTSARDPAGTELGTDAVNEVVARSRSAGVEAAAGLSRAVVDRAAAHVDRGPLRDDATAVALVLRGPPTP